MTFGVTDEGFSLKRLADIKDELKDDMRTNIDPNLDLGDNTPEGQLVNIFSDRLSSLWELAQDIYDSQYPNSAEGLSLDNVASITGISRQSATKSTVTAIVSGTPSTLISSGFVASVDGNSDSRFETNQDYTIGAGGSVDIDMTAQDTGPISANSGTLTVIETPVSGVDTITNALDAELGTDTESDADLKARRKQLLQRSGTATVEGIRNAVLNIDDVSQAIVVENTDLTTDVDGRPGKSFETVVEGGLSQTIAQTIFDSKPAGIETFGGETITITDSQGISHDINFSRPSVVNIYVDVTITPNTNLNEGAIYPVDGDSQIEDAILSWAEDLSIGKDVVFNQLYTPINTVDGVFGIDLKIDTSTPVTGTSNITIAADEIASFDSSRITVTS